MTTSRIFRCYPSSMFSPQTIAVPVVGRERLLSPIVGPDARKVTVVAAPVGYGKTVLLTQAYETFTKQGRPCLWLSINGALGECTLLDLLWAAADRISAPVGASIKVTASSLLWRLESWAPSLAVVIDGLNEGMFDSTHSALWELVNGTPDHTSFLIATETTPHLPLMRLEASGLLRKIGVRELAFDDADLAVLGQTIDPPHWFSVLNDRVEGWPAIVQLALSRSRHDTGCLQALMNGSQHDIAAFLEQDVLSSLSAPELARLADAAVVDEICGPLLDAISGGHGGSAVLARLAARGMPLREAATQGWFRLHPLVRAFLYDRLRVRDADRLTLLHQRAASWLLSAGDEQAALRHGTATGSIDVLRMIYRHVNGTRALLADTGERQLAGDLPPRLSSDATSNPTWRPIFDLIQSGRLDEARILIARNRQQTPPEPSDIRPLEWEPIYSDLLLRVFDDRLPRPDQLENLRDRLMRTPDVPPSISAAVSELVVVSRFRRGDLSGVADADHNLWHTGAFAPTQSKIYVLMELAIAAMEAGDLDLASRHLTNAKSRALEAFGPHAAHAHAASALLAEVAFERGDREASLELLGQSLSRLRNEEIWFNLAASAFTTRSAAAAHRSWDDALKALELPMPLSTHVGLWRLPPLLVAQRLRLACLWGEDHEVARRDRATLTSLGLLDLGELDGAGFGWRVSVPAQLAVIRFDLADRNVEAALARAVALRPILETRNYVRRLIELDLLQGRASIEMGDHVGGKALLRLALKLSVDSGMVQSFLDEVRFLHASLDDLLLANNLSIEERAFLERLMTKLARPVVRPTRYAANGRTFDLSSREAQLLRALATGKTFKEISFALNISVNTTKMHRTRLYRKLGCNSRSHAMALAQELIIN